MSVTRQWRLAYLNICRPNRIPNNAYFNKRRRIFTGSKMLNATMKMPVDPISHGTDLLMKHGPYFTPLNAVAMENEWLKSRKWPAVSRFITPGLEGHGNMHLVCNRDPASTWFNLLHRSPMASNQNWCLVSCVSKCYGSSLWSVSLYVDCIRRLGE